MMPAGGSKPPPIKQMPLNKVFKGGGKKVVTNLMSYLNNQVQAMNQSKIFAGLMIIILNLASRFVTIKLPKTVESYLKFTFSRDLLVFAIAWMGTRDIYIALMIVAGFIFAVDFLFNEESTLCILPSHFVDRHVGKLQENSTLTPQDIESIKNLAKKLETQVNPENTVPNPNPNPNQPQEEQQDINTMPNPNPNPNLVR
jgi:hypothetical protein